jgi:hypothetical protein
MTESGKVQVTAGSEKGSTKKYCLTVEKLTLAHAATLQRLVSQHKVRFPELFRFLRLVIFSGEYGFDKIYSCNHENETTTTTTVPYNQIIGAITTLLVLYIYY